MSASASRDGERGRPRGRADDFDFFSDVAFFAKLGGRPRPRPVPVDLAAGRLPPLVLVPVLLVTAFDDEAALAARRRALGGGGGGLGSGCCTQSRSPPMSQ